MLEHILLAVREHILQASFLIFFKSVAKLE